MQTLTSCTGGANDKDVICTLAGHTAPVDALAFSPDGKLLASGSRDKTVKLWDVTTGKLKYSKKCGSAVDSVVFSSDGTRLVAGSKDSQIRIWDVPTGKLARTLDIHAKSEYEYGVEIARSPIENYFASGTEDAKVNIWNINTGEVVTTIPAQDFVVGVAFSQDGTKLACAGYAIRGSVRVVDVESEEKIWQTESDMDLMSVSVGFCDGDKQVAIREEGTKTNFGSKELGQIHLLDAQTGKVNKVVETGESYDFWNDSQRPAPCLAVSPDSKILATGADSKVLFYDASSGKKLGSYAAAGDGYRVYDVSFSPDGKSVAASLSQSSLLSNDNKIQVRKMLDLH